MKAADVLTFCGHSIPGLSIGQTVLLAGDCEPDADKAAVIERLAALFTDCGTIAPSTMAVRMSASCGATTWQSIMAGISCFGSYHFPIEQAAEFISEGRLPFDGERVPGYGHPYFKTRDPRVDAALELAEAYVGDHVQHAVAVEKILGVGLNPAGGGAAILLDLGLPSHVMPFVALMGRMVGWSRHIAEQRRQRPMVRVGDHGAIIFSEPQTEVAQWQH